jgi:diguanylate cyclase (GGDEF)-like protein
MQPIPANDCVEHARRVAETNGQQNLTHAQLMDCVEVGKAITSELDPDTLLSTIMEKVSKLLPCENWSLLMLDEATQTLFFEISIDLDLATLKDFRLPLGEGVAGQAALKQELLIVDDISTCDFFDRRVDNATGYHTQSLICVPIIFGGRTLGVMEVVNPKNVSATCISLLTMLSDYIAIAIENTRRYKQMRQMAVMDNLTGLYNQRYLYQALQRAIKHSQQSGAPLSLIFMDMDDFKEVVDTLGHLNGSRALHEVAQRIRTCLTPPAFGVAYGGDEFVVVLPASDRTRAIAVADQIRQTMKAEPYLSRWGHSVSLTASFGVAAFPDDASGIEELLAYADQAMFHAKNTGKDAVHT